jgi:hypothetical protein
MKIHGYFLPAILQVLAFQPEKRRPTIFRFGCSQFQKNLYFRALKNKTSMNLKCSAEMLSFSNYQINKLLK